MEYPRFQKGTSTHDDAARLKEKERIFRAFSSGPPQSVSCSTRDHHEGEKLLKRKSPEFHRRRNKSGMPTPHSKRMRSTLVSRAIPRLVHKTLLVRLLLMLVYLVISTTAAKEANATPGKFGGINFLKFNACIKKFFVAALSVFHFSGHTATGMEDEIPILRVSQVKTGSTMSKGTGSVHQSSVFEAIINEEPDKYVYKECGYTKHEKPKFLIAMQQKEPLVIRRLMLRYNDDDEFDMPMVPLSYVVLDRDDIMTGFVTPRADLVSGDFLNPSTNPLMHNFDPPSAKAQQWFFDRMLLQLNKVGIAEVIHGDVKAGNILMFADNTINSKGGKPRIIYRNVQFNDWDLSKHSGQPLDHRFGLYVAPERYIGAHGEGCIKAVKGQPESYTVTGTCRVETDYFSAGMLMWSACIGHKAELQQEYNATVRTALIAQNEYNKMYGTNGGTKSFKTTYREQMKKLWKKFPIINNFPYYNSRIKAWIKQLMAYKPETRKKAFNNLVASIESSEMGQGKPYLEVVEYKGADGTSRRKFEVRREPITLDEANAKMAQETTDGKFDGSGQFSEETDTMPLMPEWDNMVKKLWETRGRTEYVRDIEGIIEQYKNEQNESMVEAYSIVLDQLKLSFYNGVMAQQKVQHRLDKAETCKNEK